MSNETPERASAPKKLPDWERIETDYRAGVLSIREIASGHQISHTAIQKRAKRDGWSRDLAAKIQAKADALVAKGVVSSEVATETAATERLIVEANAEAIAKVRLRHRADITRIRNICLAMLGELEVTSEERMTVEALGDALEQMQVDGGSPKAAQKAREVLARAISIPSRSAAFKALTDSFKTLVTLEREAWGLKTDDGSGEDMPPPAIAMSFANGGPGYGENRSNDEDETDAPSVGTADPEAP